MNKFLMMAGIALLASANSVSAQNNQVDKPFFEQLKKDGVATTNVNPEIFRQKLETKGINQQKPMTVKEFFDQMTLQGVKVPTDFDREEFFKKAQTLGIEVPDYITFPGDDD
jgi:hypothetical protein